jgi:hypothetical protein
LFFIGFAQAQSNDSKIIWEAGHLLTWENFKAIPLGKTLFHANSNTGISYSWGLKGTSQKMELTYKVETLFYPEQSWVVPTSKNEHLLKHEQLHFDISELHARKLRKILANLDSTKINKDSREYLNAFYEKIDEERGAMQNAFDAESNHSLNYEQEHKWQEYVRQELGKLEAYTN